MSKNKVKNKESMRIRKRLRKWEAKQRQKTLQRRFQGCKRGGLALVLAITAMLSGCATGYTPNVQLPPRLVLQPRADIYPDIDLFNLNDLEPLPFVKHSLTELEADEAVELRAHPEREAREAIADFQLGEFLHGWGQP